MKHQAECDRSRVDERRTDEPKVCDVRHGGSSWVISRMVYHAVSPRPPNVSIQPARFLRAIGCNALLGSL